VKIVASVLIAIMIVTTFLTSRQMIRKTGWAEDPQQKMIQRLMLYGIPVSLLISGVAFPIGVVIYWTTTNLFSLGQQFWVLRKYPPPPNVAKAGGTAARTGTPAKGAKPGAKAAGGKAAGARPEPSAAAKALAPKVGAKPVKKTASPGLQARRAAAAKKAAAKGAGDDTPVDTPTASPNGATSNGAPVNGATPTDTPARASGGKPASSKKGSSARRLPG
jgi:YidC/Oxa1 family membrane protein insertase